WGVGSYNRHYIRDYNEVIMRIAELLKITNENVIYFGSSAGGFMSLMLATLHKGSLAIPNNPQVWVRLDSQTSRAKNLYNEIFPEMNEKEIFSMFSNRLSVISMMKQENYIPNIFYLLNRYSNKDYEEQYKPFKEFLDKRNMIENSHIEFLMYHSDKGHSGIYDRKKTADLINSFLTTQKTIKLSPIFNKIYVRNHKGEFIQEIRSDGKLYLPQIYLKKNYYVETNFKFNKKEGNAIIKLVNTYKNSKGKKHLQLEVLINDQLSLTEDLALNNKPIVFELTKLKKDTTIKIRIRCLKNLNKNSWSRASLLKIIDYTEKTETTSHDLKIKSNSPYSNIY